MLNLHLYPVFVLYLMIAFHILHNWQLFVSVAQERFICSFSHVTAVSISGIHQIIPLQFSTCMFQFKRNVDLLQNCPEHPKEVNLILFYNHYNLLIQSIQAHFNSIDFNSYVTQLLSSQIAAIVPNMPVQKHFLISKSKALFSSQQVFYPSLVHFTIGQDTGRTQWISDQHCHRTARRFLV